MDILDERRLRRNARNGGLFIERGRDCQKLLLERIEALGTAAP
jgi:hypothetical protein